MHTPAATTRMTGLMLSSSAAGMANMATPTPNQPIWVRAMRAEGSLEPTVPKERWASRSRDSPVSLAM